MNSNALIIGGCFGGLYLLRRCEALVSNTKFNWINRCTGFAKLYLLYTAHSRLTQLELPLTLFPLFLLNKFISVYAFSYGLSVITFIVGYPILTSLYYYSDYILRRLIGQLRHNFIINGQSIPIDQALETMRQFIGALEGNRNWSLSYHNLVLKSYDAAIVISEAQLEQLCPLRCLAKTNGIQGNHDCSICNDEIHEQQLHRQLPCQHVFHAPCVDQWLMLHKTCPNCRRELVVK
jgi:hypothetical protein